MENPKIQEDNVDSWYGVQDPRQRKKIQDRQAQRARRKRLSESGQNPKSLVVQHRTKKSARGNAMAEANVDPGHAKVTMANIMTPSSASSWSSCSNTWTDTPNNISISFAAASDTRLPRDQPLFPDPKMSVVVALTINGSILGMSCNNASIVRSSPQPASVPQSLHPTALQLSIPHYDWIDRWPCPRARDSMITMIDLIDVKEFFFDFFSMESFTLRDGEPVWNPRAWQISPAFDAKWGYLFR